MKTLVVYDSYFGNTEKIALSIAGVFMTNDHQLAYRADQAGESLPDDLDLLIIGAPTQKFQATAGIKAFIGKLPKEQLRGLKIAVFDTRVSTDDVKAAFLRFLINLFGYAAPKLRKLLARKGAKPVGEPEGFYVKDTKGPLHEGELERSEKWARKIKQAVEAQEAVA